MISGDVELGHRLKVPFDTTVLGRMSDRVLLSANRPVVLNPVEVILIHSVVSSHKPLLDGSIDVLLHELLKAAQRVKPCKGNLGVFESLVGTGGLVVARGSLEGGEPV